MKRRPGLQGLARAQHERVRRGRCTIDGLRAVACRRHRRRSRPPPACTPPAPAPPSRPQRQFNAVGEQVAETKAAVMRGQMAHFKESLEEFAAKHRADIRSNPEFRRVLPAGRWVLPAKH